MPIFRINEALIHFAHVPKCGGTSVTRYLEARFGPMSMFDKGFRKAPMQPWTRSSPQHVPHAYLDALLGPNIFTHRFAIVRHPAERFVSAYAHQGLDGALPKHRSAGALLKSLPSWDDEAHFATDNHFRLACEIVPEDAVVFRLEDGFEPLVAWLDRLEGKSHDELQPKHANSGTIRASKKGRKLFGIFSSRDWRLKLTPSLVRQIAKTYSADLTRFDYPVLPEAN